MNEISEVSGGGGSLGGTGNGLRCGRDGGGCGRGLGSVYRVERWCEPWAEDGGMEGWVWVVFWVVGLWWVGAAPLRVLAGVRLSERDFDDGGRLDWG